MKALLDVVKVSAKPGYLLELEFENGELRLFDMSPIIDKKPFGRLKQSNAFFGAHVDYGTVVWPGNIDIDPETLYDRSIPCMALASHDQTSLLKEAGSIIQVLHFKLDIS